MWTILSTLWKLSISQLARWINGLFKKICYTCNIALIMLERTTKQSNKLYHSYKATFEVIHAFQLFWYTCFYINCNYDIPTFLYHPFFDFKWYKCFRCYIIFILYEIFNSFVLIHWVNYMNFLTSSFKGIYAECTHTVPVCLLSKYIQDCLACCCITLFVTGHTLSLS